MRLAYFLSLFSILFLLTTCRGDQQDLAGNSGFSIVPTEYSGLTFTNTITESDSFNYFTYPYLFLGGGIAVGDFDGDDRADLFFTGNQVPNRLYRNAGNLRFEDMSEIAGVMAADYWCTGATTLDINVDGHLDLYVCTAGNGAPTA
ncbi:MAG: VCBS repeat-containing protein, partial [Bacteroidota bacterium]